MKFFCPATTLKFFCPAATRKDLTLRGICALLMVLAATSYGATLHVWRDNPGTPAAPYGTWATAAKAIQDAVDAAVPGDIVLVTNGVYDTGGGVTPGHQLLCRVVVTNSVMVRSVNGPNGTVILGSGPLGASAVRGVYMTNGVVLAGFTISNCFGNTAGWHTYDRSGAGVFLDNGGVVTNCIIAETVTRADSLRGGAVLCNLAGEVVDCVIERNENQIGSGGGVNCWWGGTVRNCRIVGNSAGWSGGGVYAYMNGAVIGCAVLSNIAVTGGGISLPYTGIVDRCVVAWNAATNNSGGGITAHGAGTRVMNSTISHNYSGAPDQWSGGGGASVGWGGMISNCVVYGNRCASVGGGLRVLYGGSYAANCAVYGNRAAIRGGGVDLSEARLLSCSVFDNEAMDGGGVYFSYSALAANTIVYHNRAVTDPNCQFINTTWGPPTNIHCCTMPVPPANVPTYGLVTNEPILAGVANPHILTNSPCINMGTNDLAIGADIDNEGRIAGSAVDIGCDEVVVAGLTGVLTAGIHAPYTVVVVRTDAPFYAAIAGKAAELEWQIVTNGGTRDVGDTGAIQQSWETPGSYAVVLTARNTDGSSTATVMVQVVSAYTNYVALTGGHVPPFASLAHAATSIIEGVRAASPGAVTIVSNGVYAEATQVVVDKPLTVEGLAGRETVVLDGGGVRRGVLLAHVGAHVEGMTISNCFHDSSGGGAYVMQGVVADCVLVDNEADRGAGVTLDNGATLTGSVVRWNFSTYWAPCGAVYFNYGGVAAGCKVVDNRTSGNDGGGLCFNYGGTAVWCVIAGNRADDGAGAFFNYGGEMDSCIVTGNYSTLYATSAGGGAYCNYGGIIRNSLVAENQASGRGGGVRGYNGGRLINTTVVGNRTAGYGGGYYSSGMTLENSIVYHNRATVGSEYYHAGSFVRRYSCTTPLTTSDVACTDVQPGMAGVNNPHLLSASPCIDTGSNELSAGIAWDIDGEQRVFNGVVDMGCDELVPAGLTGTLTAAILTDYTNAVMGAPLVFRADVRGKAQGIAWTIATGYGVVIVSNQTETGYSWLTSGTYQVVLNAWNGDQAAAATVMVTMMESFTNYVDIGSATPAAPYTTWASAATSIVDAVDVAAAGGVTLVTTGIYRERTTIMMERPLRLEGVCGPGQAVVDGRGTRRGLLTGTAGSIWIVGIGFSNCYADYGAGVYCHAGDTISNCLFSANRATSDGGGVFCVGEAQVVDSVFWTNAAANGGGMSVNGTTVRGCVFGYNKATASLGYGGGAHVYGGTVRGCSFLTNYARYGGGAYIRDTRLVHDTWFVGNVATASSFTDVEGGGLYCFSVGAVSNCVFMRNRCGLPEGYGGGVNARYSLLQDCRVEANDACQGGGGALFSSTAERCLFVSNTITRFYWDPAPRGAGVHMRLASVLRGSRVADNHAMYGGGGGIAAHTSSIITNSVITGNRCSDWNGGGGIYCDGGAVVADSLVVANTSGENGGGVHAYASTIFRCIVISNSTGLGSGGGGILLESGGRVLDSLVACNVASNNGGGISVSDPAGNTLVEHCTVADNIAGQLGGGIRLDGGSRVRNSIVMDNSATLEENIATSAASAVEHTCAAPAPAGVGNFDAVPLLAGVGNAHILPGSPCIDAGTNTQQVAIDIDGEPRQQGARVDVGCDEVVAGGLTGSLAVAIIAPNTNVAVDVTVPLYAQVKGKPMSILWTFQTGSSPATITNQYITQFSWPLPGEHAVICTVTNGDYIASDTVTVHVTLPVTNYVSPDGANIYPYSTWAKAAHTIADAVNVAGAGGVVMVSNGIYRESSQMLLAYKPMKIASRAGWAETIIDCSNAHRAAIVFNQDVVIEGFTIRNGLAPADILVGGGAVILYKKGVVRNCVFIDNRAEQYGGAVVCVDGGRVENCFFTGNEAQFGGGVACYGGGTVVNSTLRYNRGLASGGGITCQDGGVVLNSIIQDNIGAVNPNYFNYGSGMYYLACSTTPHPGDPLSFTNAPMVAGIGNPHLLTNSPCIGAGSNDAVGSIVVDIDGEQRIVGGRVDVGCDEMVTTNLYGVLAAAIDAPHTNTAPGYALVFRSDVRGKVQHLAWQIEMPTGVTATVANQPEIRWSWPQTGMYQVVLAAYNAGAAASATVTVHVVEPFTNYVAKTGGHVAPFLSWDNAATTILAAVSASQAGNVVLVSNGVYREEGEVVLDQAVLLMSLSNLGAQIDGQQVRRCIRVDDPQAVVDGFSMYRGEAKEDVGGGGGGVLLNGGGSVLNCRISTCRAAQGGGGVMCYGGGTVSNCMIDLNTGLYGGGVGMLNGGQVMDSAFYNNTGNQLGGGVACYNAGSVERCIFRDNWGNNGGGIYLDHGGVVEDCAIYRGQSARGSGIMMVGGGMADRCAVYSNTSFVVAGGVCLQDGGELRNSVVWMNDAQYEGGILLVRGGLVANCTVVSNRGVVAGYGGVRFDGGGTISNSIVYHNIGTDITTPTGGVVRYTCTSGVIGGDGNMTNAPRFTYGPGGMFQLAADSPCINEGTNQPWMAGATDLAGAPRVAYGSVDMGCFEFTTEGFWCWFRGVPRVVVPGTNVAFGSVVAGTNVASPYYLWDINGDGAAETQGLGVAACAYAYQTVGVYTVRLVVSNGVGEGATSVKPGYIRVEYPQPFVDMLVSSYPLEFPDVPTNIVFSGTNNAAVVGMMWLSNAASGQRVVFPAALSWTAPPMTIDLYTNVIWVFGSNAYGNVASDTVVAIGIPEPGVVAAAALCAVALGRWRRCRTP